MKGINLIIGGILFIPITIFANGPRPLRMVEIPAGYFYMGSDGTDENADERPIHKVVFSSPFYMSETEITNAQFEEFQPNHLLLRGTDGISTGDNEPVTNVTWYDAMSYCSWLSEKYGRNFRLPTEAEWEYACKAGTASNYWTGDSLPQEFHRNQVVARNYAPVNLTVGTTTPNRWGLFEMHGNVEEWCYDWYGTYNDSTVTDPCGPQRGEFKVTRGGSHHTPEKYLRSANRMAMLPSDSHSLTGFRVVESPVKLNYVEAATEIPLHQQNVNETPLHQGFKYINEPIFMEPIPFVIEPDSNSTTPFYRHNHQPAITWCDNGDMLAIWFSANEENGREMVVLASRLRDGRDAWDEASLFYKVPDRNMTGSSIVNDRNGRLLHFNGVEAAGDWQNLAIVLRESTDNGATWSSGRLIQPTHARRHQIIAGPIITKSGDIIQMCDAGPGGDDGSAIHISHDNGHTWSDLWDGDDIPEFVEGNKGSTVAGIHAGIVELSDGRLMAMGRGNAIADSTGEFRMPISISADKGHSWTYSASPFPPIQGGQRLALLRLAEGPIMLVSFTDHPLNTPPDNRGMDFVASDGSSVRKYGMFVALSYDDGKTWPVRKLLTDGLPRVLDGGAWTGSFETDATHAEPRGYLAVTQSPDGIIHLLSSRLHYRFNLSWIESKKE